jgi:hypothetical protein
LARFTAVEPIAGKRQEAGNFAAKTQEKLAIS